MQDKKDKNTKSARRVYIRTFGCQMNDRDSEALAGLFLARGYALAQDPKEADVVLVNTCSVREHAEERAISYLGTLKNRKPKTDNRTPVIIGLIGCMAKARGEEIVKRMKHVNLICAPGCLDRVVEYVEKLRRGGWPSARRQIIDLEDRAREECFYEAPYRLEPGHAQVVISTGCSNYCTYCVVPYVRGNIRCRAPQDIIREVERNIKQGITKITLLGQNVNDYSYSRNTLHASRFTKYASRFTLHEMRFVDLLREVIKVKGLEELSFVTSHPKNTSKELFTVMAESDKIKKHLHLPFQSGSGRILKAMNRGYTRQDYLKLAEEYKNITHGTLSADVIIGFPGETEEDFEATRSLLETVKFRFAYIFKYSPRPGTQASKMPDDVPEKEKSRRHKQLLDLQKKISAGFK